MKQNVNSMVELARAHVEAGGFRPAEVYYRMIIKACDPPQSPVDRIALGEAYWFFASHAVADGRHGEACDWYQRALFADPLAVEYMIQFVIKALLPMAMFKTAKIVATRATRVEPENKDAWRALGIACAALCEPEESTAAYDRQLKLDSENPLAVIDRASIAINTGDHATAFFLANSMKARPDFAKYHGDAEHLIALTHYREARHETAIQHFEAALKVGCLDPEQARWNMSLAQHAIGLYREGWENSESRGTQKGDEAMRLVMNRFQRGRMTKVELDGRPLRVHVHHEMGNGDAFAMARYLDLLCDRGHDVRLETMDSMVELFQHSFPRVKIIPRALDYPGAAGIPEFDVHIPTLSLPALFGTDIDNIPWRGPYIRATKPSTGLRPRIGVCWSSGIRNDGLWISEYGRRKSMHFDTFLPIIEIIRGFRNPRISVVSLQVGPERWQARGFINDDLSLKPDWDETANLIASLDLVITVDTAVAHLAGAMGVPVWVLCQRDACTWHFMRWTEGAPWNDRSPWYPSARIFRQPEFNQPHQWGEVVSEVCGAIRQYHTERHHEWRRTARTAADGVDAVHAGQA